MTLSFVVENGVGRGLSVRELARRTRAMARRLQIGNLETSITLTSDAQIRELNRTYRATDRPTDVLAFAMREGEFASAAGGILGDVVVSVDTARAQARAHGHPLASEITMLVAHGLLHLIGRDHDTARKAAAMTRETEALCEAAGDARAVRPAEAPVAPKTPRRAKPGTKAPQRREGRAR